MLFPRSFLLAVLSAPFLVLAADNKANPFTIPTAGLSASAGQTLTLNWKPTTDGTVSLILRSGGSDNLAAGTTIAKSIQNSGSYDWKVPSDAVRGSDYAVEIVSDSDPSQTNYTPYFVLESSNTGATKLGSATLGAPTTSLSLSTAKPTVETTSSGTRTVTSSSSSASETGSTLTRSVTSSTAAATSGTNNAVSSASGSGTSTVSQAGAARATQFAGLLGAVALGAFAL